MYVRNVQIRLVMLRIYLSLALIASLIGCGWYVSTLPEKYREQGRQEVLKKQSDATKIAIDKRNAEIEIEKRNQEIINRKVISDYELKLSNQAHEHDKRVADIRKSGGLRILKNDSCGLAGKAETTSAERDHDASTIRLPGRVESDLFDLAKKADETVAQLGVCQAWIKDNGFSK